MTILKVAIGNQYESFIEDRFLQGCNIISSDENNKGKTIVIQSMMYALGNEPIFPSSFDYKNYYHYIEISVNNEIIIICRNNNNFVVKKNGSIDFFDSVSEFKYYWTKNIFKLPVIEKDFQKKIVDPVLFLQLFFIGQDKKDSSSIVGSSYYKKDDFKKMIFNIMNIEDTTLDFTEIEKIKDENRKLNEEEKLLKQKHKILTSKATSLAYVNATNDREQFKKKLEAIESKKNRITELKNLRNKYVGKKLKWEELINELNSLNRIVKTGELRCLNCNSSNIAFIVEGNKKFAFDVSTPKIRNNILNSIKDKVIAYKEEIDKVNFDLENEQENLINLLEENDISLESIVIYKKDIFTAKDADKKLTEIANKKRKNIEQMEINEDKLSASKIQQKECLQSIVNEMNRLYKIIDSTGSVSFTDLFSQKDIDYSGSENTIFYIVKLLALQKITKHTYPIIIDSFRAEDLSTTKEDIVLYLFRQISNQVILTTTLKAEELGKYNNYTYINSIDYTNNTPSHILNKINNNDFYELINNLNICLTIPPNSH